MTGVNFNLEVTKDPDSTDGTKNYMINILLQNAIFNFEINDKLISRRLRIRKCKLF